MHGSSGSVIPTTKRRKRRAAFIAAAVAVSVVIPTAAFLAADLYAHARYAQSAGLNRSGYRGRVLGRKVPGEHRVAMLGGSTAFGYGVLAQETVPAYLEQELAARREAAGQGVVSVANLAYNGEGAFAAKLNLRDYLYLEPDVVIFYDGYNDLGTELNSYVYRHESPIFRLTGYMPILPLVLEEKALLLRYGSVDEGYHARYRGKEVVYSPGLVDRAAAVALDTTEHIRRSVEGQVGSWMPPPPRARGQAIERQLVIQPHARECGARWQMFCELVIDNIDDALSRGLEVVVASQPHLDALHAEQQNAMAAMLQARYAGTPAVVYVNLATAVTLTDRRIAWDGKHLTSTGNQQIARQLAGPVFDVLARRPAARMRADHAGP